MKERAFVDVDAGIEPGGRAEGFSIVLPARARLRATAVPLRETVDVYVQTLEALKAPWEIVLAPFAQREAESACVEIAQRSENVRVCSFTGGWGAAVLAGLRASEGELLCYTDHERTTAHVLSKMLRLAQRHPQVVLRANRRTRDTLVQRLGSLLFNLECRLLLGVSTWDINATPKVFPRAFRKLLELECEDDLLDVEFSLVCEREGYPVIEVPIDAVLDPALGSRSEWRAALHMYSGVPRLRARTSDAHGAQPEDS